MQHPHRHHRGGRWLPSDPGRHAAWLSELKDDVERDPQPLHPAVAALGEHIARDPRANMLFHLAFEQVAKSPPFNKPFSGDPEVPDVATMLKLLSAVLAQAPEYDRTGVVGAPVNAVLDRIMGTPAGCAAFLDPEINAHLRTLLNAWAEHLRSPASCAVLSDDPRRGWFGEDAMHDIPDFDGRFECDPSAPHHGFTSWDDFFTRRLRPGVRPVAAPDYDRVIVSACEAAPYRIAKNVREVDRFWIKAQPYSLRHLLADDETTPRFVGGTVYQGYLAALSYHRWHSPVAGRVVRTRVVPGTYFSEILPERRDPAGPKDSQGYIPQVAARALIFIEADDPAIGLIALALVGMAEVSTCEITALEGRRVAKGEELGMFHYGGSTWCLLLRPETRVRFRLHGHRPGLKAGSLDVCSALAVVAR